MDTHNYNYDYVLMTELTHCLNFWESSNFLLRFRWIAAFHQLVETFGQVAEQCLFNVFIGFAISLPVEKRVVKLFETVYRFMALRV